MTKMKTFKSLPIRKEIIDALKEMGIEEMTPIQTECIEKLLDDKDLMGAAKTGSGKTLAFLVPLLQKILVTNHELHRGTQGIVISPTRELSEQIFNVLEKLVANTDVTIALVTGGANKRLQGKKLRQGSNIVVATPGRLLDHMRNTKDFLTYNTSTLVCDEADKLMNQGFFNDIGAIIAHLPRKRQTVLFSATLEVHATQMKQKIDEYKLVDDERKLSVNEKIFKLASISLRENCVFVDQSCLDLPSIVPGAANASLSVTNNQLKQAYYIVTDKMKWNFFNYLLYTYKTKKIIVFMASSLEVNFYKDALLRYVPKRGQSVLALHGKLSQADRNFNLSQFRTPLSQNEDGGGVVMLCTDVASRGLDIDDVDLVLQYDTPSSTQDYVHRVGRTARAGCSGLAITLVRESELDIIRELKITKINVGRAKCPENVKNVFNKYLQSSSISEEERADVMMAYMDTYRISSATYHDLVQLDLKYLARAFGLDAVPSMCQELVLLRRNKQNKKRRLNGGEGRTSKRQKRN